MHSKYPGVFLCSSAWRLDGAFQVSWLTSINGDLFGASDYEFPQMDPQEHARALPLGEAASCALERPLFPGDS